MSDRNGAQAQLGRIPTVVAVVLIIVFLTMLVMLALMRSDPHWDRLVYLLTGLEALVFAGAGALFGSAVQRGQTEAAQQSAASAQAQADTERARADSAEQSATAGRLLGTAVLAKARRQETADPGIRGGRPDEDPHAFGGAADGDLAELAALARAVFPPDSEGAVPRQTSGRRD